MSQKTSTRRGILKQAGLGAATAGTLSVATSGVGQASTAASSGRRELMSVDVLVVGGGTAGIGAALGAARTGADTLLIETHGFFGGIGAWALGMPINQMRPVRTPRSVARVRPASSTTTRS